jgi:hypothetical protein
MPCVPQAVRLTVPGSLALHSAAGSLPVSHAYVGQKRIHPTVTIWLG